MIIYSVYAAMSNPMFWRRLVSNHCKRKKAKGPIVDSVLITSDVVVGQNI
eukprot:gnl/Chilomastix_caulleri/3092.p1 GENE.gnl/Chilomastix_caulleri/3092~~gnl/Chilomastix_caulleri/3092.p1  ORF type:complete len:50 (-),score=6.63 gnl/Chilomastix_caulleri/3092:373-522(-)